MDKLGTIILLLLYSSTIVGLGLFIFFTSQFFFHLIPSFQNHIPSSSIPLRTVFFKVWVVTYWFLCVGILQLDNHEMYISFYLCCLEFTRILGFEDFAFYQSWKAFNGNYEYCLIPTPGIPFSFRNADQIISQSLLCVCMALYVVSFFCNL